MMLQRPESNEYNPYFERYIRLVPEGSLLHILKAQQEETQDILSNLSDSQGAYRYEPGKWSLKDIVGHIADTERVMSYRLLVLARGDDASLPSFNQDRYVSGADFNRRELRELAADLWAVRQSTRSLLSGLSDDAWVRAASVGGHNTTPRALAYIIAGHELHHRQVMKDRYL